MTDTDTPAGLNHVVACSLDYYETLAEALGETIGTATHRSILALGTASTALEHGLAILTTGHGCRRAAASVLLRAQFEAVTRALWLHYCADDPWIEAYFRSVRDNPNRDPGTDIKMQKLLDDLETHAPPAIARMLQPLKQGAWGPLNSYVHSGIHAIAHQHLDLTDDFADSTLRNANGLAGMAAMLIAMSSGDSEFVHRIAQIQHDHLDCLPPLNPTPAPAAGPG